MQAMMTRALFGRILGPAAVGVLVTPLVSLPIAASAAPAPVDAPEPCTIVGTSGDDVLRGTPGRDVICGRGGDDVLIGRGGDDILRGGRGADRLDGGRGDDVVIGGRGADRVVGGPGSDLLRGGAGRDRVDARDAERFRDRVRCDGGRDVALADTRDRVAPACDVVRQNHAPTGVRLTPGAIAENEPAGSQVGRLSAVDPDARDSHVFTLVAGPGDDDNASFEIDGSRLLSTRSFDFETEPELSVRVRAVDAAGYAAAGTLVVSVTDVFENRSPVAVDDAYTVDEDAELDLPVSGPGSPAANDTDADGDPLTVSHVDGATGGAVTLVGGRVRFVPDADLCGSAAGGFDYAVGDGRGGRGTAHVQVDITCLPDTPVARDDAVTLTEDDPATAVDVLANDSDADGDPLVIGAVTQGADGAVVITGGGTGLTYEPDADFCGLDSFTYTLDGGTTATVDVTVTCVDDPAVAVDDTATLTEDDPATAVDVLANDSDVESDPFVVTAATQGADGAVAITGGGTGLTYEPDADFCGSDSFTYTITGGDSATVDVTVTCVNDPAVAVDDDVTTTEDNPVNFDVGTNDYDVESDPFTFSMVTVVAHGTVVLNTVTGSATYTPTADYCGADSFTYSVTGGDTATVSITVDCVDDAPVAVDDAQTTPVDEATDVDVLANDTDVDGGDISVDSVTQPTNGTVTIIDSGAQVHYVPDAAYCNDPPGTTLDTFTYTLAPGSSSATVEMTVTCADVPPVAVADSKTVGEDASATAIDVLANDTDSDGGPMSVASVTQPSNGTVVITGGGTGLTYQPDANYCNNPPGTTLDTFTYTLSPGSSSATVTVTVTCVDDAPVAVDDAATVTEDDAATAVDVLANDTDVDGGSKSVASVTQPSNGTVVITGGGTGLTYAPDADYCNNPPAASLDTFTYTLTPGSSTGTVRMTVDCVNDAPTVSTIDLSDDDGAIGNTTLVVNGSTGYGAVTGPAKTESVDLLSYASDVDGPGPITIEADASITTDDGGTVDLKDDGSFRYDPAANAGCADTTDEFDVTFSDGATPAAETTATVTIQVAGCVWYVDNEATAGGDGTSDAPFDTLAEAETAATADDTVFVYAGDGTSTGYATGFAMPSGGRLIGEVAGLEVDPDGSGSLSAVQLLAAAPGERPLLTASNEDVVALDDGNEVRGFTLDPSGTGGGVTGAAGDTGGGTLADLRIIDTGTPGTQPALGLTGTTGTFAVSDLIVDTSGATSPPSTEIGVRLSNAGTVTFASTGTIAVTTKGAAALDLSGTALGTSVFDDVTVTGSTTGGISMSTTTGSTTFADLDLTTTGGTTGALSLSSAGTVAVTAGTTGTINATGGPAIDATGTSGLTVALLSASSSNSSTDGLNLGGLGSSSFVISGGTISGAAGIAVDVDGGSGTVTYAGSIGNGSGATADITNRTGGALTLSGTIADSSDAGGGITLSGNSGGSTTLSGSSKALDTGTADGVRMTTSAGHTLNITGGGLVLTATSGRPLSTTSGIVSVIGSGNVLTSTTGRALDLTDTTIAAAGATFQSISSNGADIGIKLDNTGSSGELTVTGNGGTCTHANTAGCSGGTIANGVGADDAGTAPVGTGIVLRNTRAPSLTRMWIHDHANYAVRGSSVSGLTIANSVVDGTNGTSASAPYRDSALAFTDLTGTASIRDSYVGGGFEDNLRIANTTGTADITLDTVTVATLHTGASSSLPSNDAIAVDASGSAAVTTTVTDSTVTGAAGDVLGVTDSSSASGSLTVTGTAFSNDHRAIATGGGGVSVVQSGAGNATVAMTGNTFGDAVGDAVLVVNSSTTATQTGTFSGNTIGSAGDVDSGSVEGDGLRLQLVDDGTSTWRVDDNTIRGYELYGVEARAGGGATSSTGTFNVTITDNTVTDDDTSSGLTNGVHLNIGTVAGDTFAACAEIAGNAVAGSGVSADVRLRQRQSTTVRLPGYGGGNTDTAAVQSFVAAKNSTGSPTVSASASGTGGGFVGGAACPLPASP